MSPVQSPYLNNAGVFFLYDCKTVSTYEPWNSNTARDSNVDCRFARILQPRNFRVNRVQFIFLSNTVKPKSFTCRRLYVSFAFILLFFMKTFGHSDDRKSQINVASHPRITNPAIIFFLQTSKIKTEAASNQEPKSYRTPRRKRDREVIYRRLTFFTSLSINRSQMLTFFRLPCYQSRSIAFSSQTSVKIEVVGIMQIQTCNRIAYVASYCYADPKRGCSRREHSWKVCDNVDTRHA